MKVGPFLNENRPSLSENQPFWGEDLVPGRVGEGSAWAGGGWVKVEFLGETRTSLGEDPTSVGEH